MLGAGALVIVLAAAGGTASSPVDERGSERRRMVAEQLASSPDGRQAVKDEAVLQALRLVPRHAFVPPLLTPVAYQDSPLPIGHGQTISQPYVVGLMTELLEVRRGDKVLEVGTGSGYQAAVLAQLGARVYSVEIVAPLAVAARRRLEALGYGSVRLREGDGYYGWAEEGPFDAVIVTCAAGHLPPPLWTQLRPGGRIVVPLGGPYDVQRLVVVTKTADGRRQSRTVTTVGFVPMTGAAQREP
jgi:protein-L-isoaspartate(D-aspartate) O-methyltransferase